MMVRMKSPVGYEREVAAYSRNYGSIEDGRELEERRLLYVALTRARRHLILTGHAAHNGKSRSPSPYLALLRGHLVIDTSAAGPAVVPG